MLVNYLKIAVRSLLKNPVYTSINVAGLAVGMTCFLLIALYVQDEYEYDAFHENLDRIVRITSHYSDDSGTRSFARSNPAVGPTLLRDFSEIEQTVRLQRFQGPLQYEDRVFNESQLFFAEASIFDVFTFPLERGNPHTALVNPNTAVLSKTAAHRFFGERDPIGEVIVLSDTLEFTVTGIAYDVPQQAHLRFEILLSFSTYQNLKAAQGVDLDNHWSSGTFYTYALLSQPDALPAVESGLSAVLERYVGSQETSGTQYSLVSCQPSSVG